MASLVVDQATKMLDAFRRLEADLEALTMLQEQISSRRASYAAALSELVDAESRFSKLLEEHRLITDDPDLEGGHGRG